MGPGNTFPSFDAWGFPDATQLFQSETVVPTKKPRMLLRGFPWK
ncbi:hypothetical protein LMED105_10670 [Limnobacter sp. MED105]|nr:hypothetical protein LMED105_10670 [Limnobacter sp. MED105]